MKPTLQAFILAKAVSRDASGAFTITETLDKVEVYPGINDIPRAVSSAWSMYLSLTGLTNDKSLIIKFMRLDDGLQAAGWRIAVEANGDPLAAVILAKRMPPVPLRLGPHAIEIWDGEELVGSCRFRVVEGTNDPRLNQTTHIQQRS